jgi:hypothetical protein
VRRRLARGVVVAFDGEASIPLLVEQLHDADPLEHRQIVAVLHALSGVRPGPDDAAWRRWLADELQWSAVHASSALDDLRSRDAAAVARAIQTLSARTYQRARWSLAIAELLEGDRSLAVRKQACLALGRLRSSASRGALEALTSDPSPELRELAARTLAGLAR